MSSFLFSVLLLIGTASAQLSSTFYDKKCPKALSTIQSGVKSAISKEARMGASLVRLHFHDCFVNASPPIPPLHTQTDTSFIYMFNCNSRAPCLTSHCPIYVLANNLFNWQDCHKLYKLIYWRQGWTNLWPVIMILFSFLFVLVR